MKKYRVTYEGNASRFKNFSSEVNANSEREAVERVYADYLNQNYFPQENGLIQDCNGMIIAEKYDYCIEYDGGYFSAVEKDE